MAKAIQLVPAMEEGGVERYVVELNRILVRAGWKNVVVSRGGKLDATIAADGGRVVHHELKSKNPLTALARAWRLRRFLKRERPDVVCAHSRVPAWLFVLASRGLGIKWITYAHGANSISRYSRVMTMGDVVMCPSNFVLGYLQKAYGLDGSRCRVIPHGIDAARFDPDCIDRTFVAQKREEWGIGPGAKVIMSIGRITRIKGFDTLIRAYSHVKSHGVGEMKLVIVGGAEQGKMAYLGELEELVRKLGLEGSVVFAGTQTKIPECLSMADVVVSANTTKPESFGLTIAEALMMGRPVVAKAFGGALDIVRDGMDGVLVREGEKSKIEGEGGIAMFAEAIANVLQSQALHLQTPTSIRSSARERFDFDIMSKRTLTVYEELAR